MTDEIAIELPPRTHTAVGNRWLSVISIAQGAIIGETLVQLISLERRTRGALLSVRISRLEEVALTEPADSLPWPKLRLAASDDTDTTYRFDGGAGRGSQSDWDVEYGMVGAIPEDARSLSLTISELYWEDLSTGNVKAGAAGEWVFSVDLTRELHARMI